MCVPISLFLQFSQAFLKVLEIKIRIIRFFYANKNKSKKQKVKSIIWFVLRRSSQNEPFKRVIK